MHRHIGARQHGNVATRVLISLQPGTDPGPVVAALMALGAESVQPPQPELPDVCIAVIDEVRFPPDDWIARASQIAGVAGAEVDRMRWSY